MNMRRLNWLIALAVAAVVTTACILSRSPAESQTTTLSIGPPERVCPAEEVCSVDIKVEDVTNLGSFEFIIDFGSVISFDHFEQGPFLGSTGRTVQCSHFHTAEGSERYGCASGGQQSGPSASGVLAKLWFKGETAGETALDLHDTALYDATQLVNPISHTVEDGHVTVIPPGSPTPSPTPAATSSPTPQLTPMATPTPPPSPTGTPQPGTVPLVAGWNDSCFQGRTQAIGDAFASVIASVQAVYRMKPDGTFDRWFPARTDLSTITTLNPFDQLFILGTTDAVWTVQPLAERPSSTALNRGWNSICYLGTDKDTDAAAEGISGSFSIIYSLSPGQIWRRYVPGRPDLSDLAQLGSLTSVLVLITDTAGALWDFDP